MIRLHQSIFPAKSNFLFTPVDLPQPDFSNLAAYIQNKDIKGWWEAFFGDIENSLKQNGTLNINCYVVNQMAIIITCKPSTWIHVADIL